MPRSRKKPVVNRRERVLTFAERCRAIAAFEDDAIEGFVRERALELAEECRARDPRTSADDLLHELLALLGWIDCGDPAERLVVLEEESMPACRLAKRCEALVRAIDGAAAFRRR